VYERKFRALGGTIIPVALEPQHKSKTGIFLPFHMKRAL
jgi:hypothetical protein